MKKVQNYRWVVFLLCTLMIFICLGFCSSPKSLYLKAITNALNIDRSVFAINDSCRFITTAIVNLFFGSLIIKFGTKKLIAAGFLSLIASCLTYSFATNAVTLCIGGCLLGIGLSWTTTAMVSSILTKWFTKNKGTILGFALATNGLGGAVSSPIIKHFIDQSTFGYKNAYRLVALILVIVAVIVLIFIKDNKDFDKTPSDSHKKKTRSECWEGLEYKEIFKKWYFYTAAICIFLTGFILQSSTGVAAAHIEDAGLGSVVATMMSIHSLALTGFKFVVGFLYDRIGLRKTTLICYLATIATLLLLYFAVPGTKGKIIALSYGVISSLALPLETIMLPIYAGDLFGEKAYDRILGLILSINVAGYALGAPAINLWYDIFNSYTSAFLLCIILVVLVMILLQFTITAANREKQR